MASVFPQTHFDPTNISVGAGPSCCTPPADCPLNMDSLLGCPCPPSSGPTAEDHNLMAKTSTQSNPNPLHPTSNSQNRSPQTAPMDASPHNGFAMSGFHRLARVRNCLLLTCLVLVAFTAFGVWIPMNSSAYEALDSMKTQMENGLKLKLQELETALEEQKQVLWMDLEMQRIGGHLAHVEGLIETSAKTTVKFIADYQLNISNFADMLAIGRQVISSFGVHNACSVNIVDAQSYSQIAILDGGLKIASLNSQQPSMKSEPIIQSVIIRNGSSGLASSYAVNPMTSEIVFPSSKCQPSSPAVCDEPSPIGMGFVASQMLEGAVTQQVGWTSPPTTAGSPKLSLFLPVRNEAAAVVGGMEYGLALIPALQASLSQPSFPSGQTASAVVFVVTTQGMVVGYKGNAPNSMEASAVFQNASHFPDARVQASASHLLNIFGSWTHVASSALASDGLSYSLPILTQQLLRVKILRVNQLDLIGLLLTPVSQPALHSDPIPDEAEGAKRLLQKGSWVAVGITALGLILALILSLLLSRSITKPIERFSRSALTAGPIAQKLGKPSFIYELRKFQSCLSRQQLTLPSCRSLLPACPSSFDPNPTLTFLAKEDAAFQSADSNTDLLQRPLGPLGRRIATRRLSWAGSVGGGGGGVPSGSATTFSSPLIGRPEMVKNFSTSNLADALATPQAGLRWCPFEEMTLLLVDANGFNAIAANGKVELQRLAETYHATITKAVKKYHGVVDHWFGDKVFCHWNAQSKVFGHQAKACRAAFAMLGAFPLPIPYRRESRANSKAETLGPSMVARNRSGSLGGHGGGSIICDPQAAQIGRVRTKSQATTYSSNSNCSSTDSAKQLDIRISIVCGTAVVGYVATEASGGGKISFQVFGELVSQLYFFSKHARRLGLAVVCDRKTKVHLAGIAQDRLIDLVPNSEINGSSQVLLAGTPKMPSATLGSSWSAENSPRNMSNPSPRPTAATGGMPFGWVSKSLTPSPYATPRHSPAPVPPPKRSSLGESVMSLPCHEVGGGGSGGGGGTKSPQVISRRRSSTEVMFEMYELKPMKSNDAGEWMYHEGFAARETNVTAATGKGKEVPEKTDLEFDAAIELYFKGDVAQAHSHLGNFFRNHPDHPYAATARGLYLLYRQRYSVLVRRSSSEDGPVIGFPLSRPSFPIGGVAHAHSHSQMLQPNRGIITTMFGASPDASGSSGSATITPGGMAQDFPMPMMMVGQPVGLVGTTDVVTAHVYGLNDSSTWEDTPL